jgi:hypothetical protein
MILLFSNFLARPWGTDILPVGLVGVSPASLDSAGKMPAGPTTGTVVPQLP